LRLLLLGSDNLAQPLRRLGMEVYVCGPEPQADLRLADPDPDWRQIEALARAGGVAFEAVLVTDLVGSRRIPTGLWAAQAVTAFYGIDSPLNEFWHRPYAGLFDLVFVDQRAQAEALAAAHAGASWLPVGVDPELYAGEVPASRQKSVCFVGVQDPRVRPKRTAMLAKVARRARLEVRGGRRREWFPTAQAAALYRQHQVALNENLFPGVTTRPLEIMAAGGCLLSEAAPGAMDLFFQDGEHLFYFGPDELEQKLELCLGDSADAHRAVEAGRELVRAEHGLEQRAREIVKRIEVMAAQAEAMRPRAKGGEALRLEGEALLMAGLRWPGPESPRRLVRAAGRLRAAAADGAEPLAAARAAGRACLALGQGAEARAYLARAAEAGGPADALALRLAGGETKGQLPATGDVSQANPLAHLAMAELLAAQGQDLCPGFSRRGLPPLWWTAIEHLLEATRLDPGQARAWEMAGDLLLARGAANQAHDCFASAAQTGGGPRLGAKLQQAAQQGYLT
jgi:tetratricopeptide (TPR) repeat protein